jgi:hypothetical protein
MDRRIPSILVTGALSCVLPSLAHAQAAGNASLWTSPTTQTGSPTILYVEGLAGWGGTPTQNRTAIQNAQNSLPAGGTIILPAGTFQLDGTTITLSNGVTLRGQGGNNNTGTRLQTTSATANVVTVTTGEPVHIESIAFTSSVTRTGGAYIRLQGNGGSSTIRDLLMLGHHYGIEAATGSNTDISDCVFYGARSADIFWNNGGTVLADAGAQTISKNLFVGGAVDKTAIAIWIRSGGGPRITGNKFLGDSAGVPGLSMAYAAQLFLDWVVAPSSSIMPITSNSFDGGANYKVLLNSAAGQGGYSQIQIVGNQFIGGDVVSLGLETGGANPAAIREVVVTGNTFVATPGSLAAILTNGTENTHITGNTFAFYGGGTAPTAISIGSLSTNTLIGVNQYNSPLSWAATISNASTTTRIDDRTALPLSRLPGTVANGSLMYCSDCVVAASCAAGGTGAFAKRLNGAWVCN